MTAVPYPSLHFDTDPSWIGSVQKWAASVPVRDRNARRTRDDAPLAGDSPSSTLPRAVADGENFDITVNHPILDQVGCHDRQFSDSVADRPATQRIRTQALRGRHEAQGESLGR